MNESKQQRFTDMWIPVSENRLPPADNEEVLLYNSVVGLIFTYPGKTARAMFLKPSGTAMTHGIEFQPCDVTHWMPAFPPEGGIASCEYYRNEVPKWKRKSPAARPRRRT